MTKRNRQAAAARRRARRRVFPRPGAAQRGWSTSSSTETYSSPEAVSTALLAAAHEHLAGVPDAAVRAADEVAHRCADHQERVQTAVRRSITSMIEAVWSSGWSPVDLYQVARRQLPTAGADYVVDAIADEAQRHTAAGLPERWREELEQIGAVPWWDHDQGHLVQWTKRHGQSWADGLVTVITVLAMLLSLPKLPRIAPPPGTEIARAPRRAVDQKVLARIRGLLAKAESTTFPDEAEALSAKAQELMSRYSLERLVVDADQGPDPASASARRFWLDSPYVAAKALLVDAVAEANRCRTALSEELGFTTVLGDEVDLDLVELLTTSLLVQATKAMVAAGSQTSRTGRSRTRSFRQSFLLAYATRIRERLTAARDAGAAEVPDRDRMLPVLAAREKAINELFESMFRKTVPRSFSVGNSDGWYAGRAAADLALLDTHRSVQ